MHLVLVVEDDFVNQEITGAMLEALGFAVELAGDGEEGVRAFVERGPRLILMDCQMPRLDGYAATRAIRTLESASGGHVPIIALTGGDRAEDRARCADSGMDDFLSKPFTRAQLGAVLDRWLAQHPAPQALAAAPAGGAHNEQPQAELPAGMRPGAIEELAEAIDRESAIAATRKFLVRLSAVVADLEAAVAAGGLEDFHRLAHSLKSTSALFGADALSRLCAEAETLARSGDGAALAMTAEIATQAAAVAGALSRHPWLREG